MKLEKMTFDELKKKAMVAATQDVQSELLRRLDRINDCTMNERMIQHKREFFAAVAKAVDGNIQNSTAAMRKTVRREVDSLSTAQANG